MSAGEWIVRAAIGAVCNAPAYWAFYRWGRREGWNQREDEVVAIIERSRP